MARLLRTLHFRDLLLLIIGTVIGSGIFLVPGAVLLQVGGDVRLALLVWIAGGVLSLLGALTYGEMAAMNPQAGGLYVFIRDTFGRFPSFLYGWTLLLAISSGSVATLAVAFSRYMGEIVDLAPGSEKIVSVGMIAFVSGINILGTRRSANVQNWATGAKVLAIAAMSAVLLTLGDGGDGAAASAAEPLLPVTGSLWTSFGLAMIGALWAYEGWQYATFSAGETIEPQRNYPRAFMVGMLALAAVYVLANVAYLAAVGPATMARSDTIAATSIAHVLGPAPAKLVALAILVSVLSAANGIQLTAPRVFYAMAADGAFFKKLAELHPRFHTPARAIALSGFWSAILAVSGTFQQLFTYVIFAGWLFYGLGAASIFVYRAKFPQLERPYRTPGYPFTPAAFVLAAAALTANTIYITPKDLKFVVALGLILSGVPAYFLWRRRG
jgi:APA family basic amino acid/polyamine antiporter